MRSTRLVAGLTAVVVAGSVTACTADEEHTDAVPPQLGWVVGSGCESTPDEVRGFADGIVDTGLSEAGYRSLYVVCDRRTPPATVSDGDLNGYLEQRGLRLSAVRSTDPLVRHTMAAEEPVPALRTGITRQVMNAQPLTFSRAPDHLDGERLATITNENAIAIARDGRASAGAPILDNRDLYSRAVGDQGLVLSMSNGSSAPRTMSITLSDIGLVGDATVAATEIWTGRRVQAADGRLTVKVGSADSALLTVG
ncbi:hypothetical protein [Gordonia zhaorongruii]|uniref:hypothetical protein n=1 Tax=Gordonia zhaorongruii TaxID=2597659 RepID=UPI00104C4C55|nr:hypothetical protein [Gordonia zhaorongruii]